MASAKELNLFPSMAVAEDGSERETEAMTQRERAEFAEQTARNIGSGLSACLSARPKLWEEFAKAVSEKSG